MKPVVPYLRVLAGMFAGITLWLTFVELINGEYAQALVQLLFTAGLAYLAVGRPLRDRRARIKAEQDALAARAEAGHLAFLAGDPAAFAPPPEPSPPPRMRHGVVVAALLAAAIVIIGIVGDISDGLDSPSRDDATTTPQTSARASASSTPATSVATSAATTAGTATTPAPTATSARAAAVQTTTPVTVPTDVMPTAVMPNVVCMNLQAAQDVIQDAGVFYSRSVDATGAGRAQVWDRNWVVVSQTPAAGALIGEGDALLSVVKEDEYSGCR